jgi:4-amino-4-deoxy-L-arabinose transferase-like glycosyltransferase
MEVGPVLMPLRRSAVWTALPPAACRLLAALLVLGAAAAHLAYLARACPLDLAPDEAHYWDWSRHLDWSYYSKGPLVAWLIRAGCALAGPWSESHTGSLAFAVRLPAVVCGSLLLVSLYVLTVQVFGRDRLALAVVALALTLPLIAVGASVMTIDAPYTCCWGWALVLGHRAVFRGSGWAWPAAGLLVGLGALAKYTMVLWVPSVALFLLTTPAYRGLLWRRGFWVMTLVAVLCCLPILVWNAQHGWMTFRHVARLAGLKVATLLDEPHEGPGLHPLGPLVYLGGQCALLLVFWFCVWAGAMWAHRPTAERDAGVRYLWWLSAPMFLWFGAFSVKTGGGEVNWPVTAYLSGLVLAAAWLGRQLASPRRWYRRLTAVNLALACGVGLAATLFMHHSTSLRPALVWLSGPPTAQSPFPLRRFDPTCRLRGYRELGVEVDRVRARLAAEGIEPVLAGCGWNMPGELGVYCAGHPQAYSVGPAVGDRHSQYDLWPNPFDRPDAFRGRTFLVVGGITPELERAFERLEPTRKFWYREGGQPVALWPITVCHGFKELKRKTTGY